MYKIWYSTEDFADYIIQNTSLANKAAEKRKLLESDANNSKFYTMPDHIKKILYLDAPDIIIELDTEPILSIEISKEAGTGHNAFQRFARLAAAVENNVPAFYIYPEAVAIERQNSNTRWDTLNPLIFKALDSVMNIYQIPALLFYHPSEYRGGITDLDSLEDKGLLNDDLYISCPKSDDPEMIKMFECIDELIKEIEKSGSIQGRNSLLGNLVFRQRKDWMSSEFSAKNGSLTSSPISSTEKIPTEYLMSHLKTYTDNNYEIGELLRSREETIIYKINAKFRGDPYPGALAALDYLMCREGKTFEDRRYNLVMLWGNMSIDNQRNTIVVDDMNGSTIDDFIQNVKSSESKNLLTKSYRQLSSDQIPRYFMQVRYGSTFSKVKHIRVYSYFADAIIFPDGALWRDA